MARAALAGNSQAGTRHQTLPGTRQEFFFRYPAKSVMENRAATHGLIRSSNQSRYPVWSDWIAFPQNN